MTQERSEDLLEEFVNLISGLRGVLELKMWTERNEVWIGFRTGKQRPPHILLQQVSRAAMGFGLDIRTVHFGILAD